MRFDLKYVHQVKDELLASTLVITTTTTATIMRPQGAGVMIFDTTSRLIITDNQSERYYNEEPMTTQIRKEQTV